MIFSSIEFEKSFLLNAGWLLTLVIIPYFSNLTLELVTNTLSPEQKSSESKDLITLLGLVLVSRVSMISLVTLMILLCIFRYSICKNFNFSRRDLINSLDNISYLTNI